MNQEELNKILNKKSISVIVKPNSSKNEIQYEENKKCLKVFIKAPPENNKANIELIKFFSKLGKKVKIIKGLKSKNKTLVFED